MTHSDNSTLSRYMAGSMPRHERLETALPPHPDCCELLVACHPADYSASALAKAVEDCDAQMLALSVTGMRDAEGHPVVMLRANSRTPHGIARSLARYGYEVIHTSETLSPDDRDEAVARVNELLHYLEI